MFRNRAVPALPRGWPCGHQPAPHVFSPSTPEASVMFLTPGDFLAVNASPDIFTYGKVFLSINIYKHLDGVVKMTLLEAGLPGLWGSAM